jgi:hypothetical protein
MEDRMRRILAASCIAGMGLAVASVTRAADQTYEMRAVVTAMDWSDMAVSAPTVIRVDVDPVGAGGAPAGHWRLTGPKRNTLIRGGLTRMNLRPGAKIVVTVRSGDTACQQTCRGEVVSIVTEPIPGCMLGTTSSGTHPPPGCRSNFGGD